MWGPKLRFLSISLLQRFQHEDIDLFETKNLSSQSFSIIGQDGTTHIVHVKKKGSGIDMWEPRRTWRMLWPGPQFSLSLRSSIKYNVAQQRNLKSGLKYYADNWNKIELKTISELHLHLNSLFYQKRSDTLASTRCYKSAVTRRSDNWLEILLIFCSEMSDNSFPKTARGEANKLRNN